MNDTDYTTTFTVDQTPAEAYAAIVNVRGWWGLDVDGPTDQLDSLRTLISTGMGKPMPVWDRARTA